MYILSCERTYINPYIGKWGERALETTGELSGAAARTGNFKKGGNKKYYKKEKQEILRKQQNHKTINKNSYK